MTKEAAADVLTTIYNTYSRYFDNYKDGVVQEAFEMATAALEAQRWISCSERLPEPPSIENYVDWTVIDGETVLLREYIIMIEGAELPTTLYWTGKYWLDSNYDYDSGIKVVAWMSMPEPYREEQNND